MLVETADGQEFDEARAVDACENLTTVAGRLKRRPATVHMTLPKDLLALDDHPIGPDFDAAIKLDWLRDDHGIEDSGDSKTRKRNPGMHGVEMAQSKPCLNPREEPPGKQAPDRMPPRSSRSL